MSGLPIVERAFGLTRVHFIERADALWLTADELGVCLGYEPEHASRLVRKLADQHADEIGPLRSRTKLVREQGTREVVIFEERAAFLLACFAKTDKAAAFRAWVVETCHDLRTKDKILVDREEWERRQDISTTLLEAYEQQSEAMRKVASAAGHILALRRHSKPREDPRQLVFSGVSFEEIEGPESEHSS